MQRHPELAKLSEKYGKPRDIPPINKRQLATKVKVLLRQRSIEQAMGLTGQAREDIEKLSNTDLAKLVMTESDKIAVEIKMTKELDKTLGEYCRQFSKVCL